MASCGAAVSVMRRSFLMVATALVVGCAGAAPPRYEGGGDEVYNRWITIDWSIDGSGTMSGYVNNNFGYTLAEVRLLVETFDASDAAIARRFEWVPRIIGPFGRSYFEVARLPAAGRHRVSVHSFTILDGPSRPFP